MIDNITLLIIKAIFIGTSWCLFYYYVRRAWNAGAIGEPARMTTEKTLAGKADLTIYWNDAYYGGIAVGLMFLFNHFAMKYVEVFYNYTFKDIDLLATL